jgi:hypothetical protein
MKWFPLLIVDRPMRCRTGSTNQRECAICVPEHGQAIEKPGVFSANAG